MQPITVRKFRNLSHRLLADAPAILAARAEALASGALGAVVGLPLEPDQIERWRDRVEGVPGAVAVRNTAISIASTLGRVVLELRESKGEGPALAGEDLLERVAHVCRMVHELDLEAEQRARRLRTGRHIL